MPEHSRAIIMKMPRLPARFEIDATHAAGYVSGMKRTLGEYLLIVLLVLIMCATVAGIVIRIYLAITGG